jgi:hypothetical protein
MRVLWKLIASTASELDRQFVTASLRHLLEREPTEAEVEGGSRRLAAGLDPRTFLLELASSPEAKLNGRLKSEAPLFVPPGHYYSPVVNVSELRDSRGSFRTYGDLNEIDYQLEKQFDFFKRISRHFGSIRFPIQQGPEFRYFFENDFYSYGDALVLSGIITEFRPKRIIEVGSGFSSAVILDTLDWNEFATSCVFVDPYPDRLKSLLRPNDIARVTILELAVQRVDLGAFRELRADDILFLDTTHVLKSGSDVVYELFQILPCLEPGVIIHFHDVFDLFEYPDQWVLSDNRSWNEIYALRAFLANNSRYEIVLLNDAVAKNFGAEVSSISPDFMKNPGGGLWLRKVF